MAISKINICKPNIFPKVRIISVQLTTFPRYLIDIAKSDLVFFHLNLCPALSNGFTIQHDIYLRNLGVFVFKSLSFACQTNWSLYLIDYSYPSLISLISLFTYLSLLQLPRLIVFKSVSLLVAYTSPSSHPLHSCKRNISKVQSSLLN